MAVPSYTTDLIDINLGTGDWVELSGAIAGGSPEEETNCFIEGTTSISELFRTTGLGSMAFDNGANLTITAGSAVFIWVYHACPNTLDTLANGGYRIAIGNLVSAYKMWKVLGKDTYTYGGWVNIVVDPTVVADFSYGSPTTSTRVFGSVINQLIAIAKGNPYVNDAIRWGRTLQVVSGQAGAYGTFVGAATANDVTTARWGLFQAIAGGYLQKGLFLMGTAATAVDFRDSNRNIFIQDTTKVTAAFNEFEVRNAGSRVDWTGIMITALGTTSKGRFITTDNADINFDTCTFTDMDTFVFMSGATILATTFRRCGIVTQGGAVFTGCKFDKASGAKALVVSAIASVTNTEFISKGTGYALEGFSSAGDYTFTNLTFTGYGADETTDAAIHVLATTGTVAISIVGGDTPTYKSEGAIVTFPSSVTLTMTVKNQAGTPIVGAWAFIDQDPPVEPWIMNMQTITGGIASVSHTLGPVTGSIWRVRKYGYKDFEQVIDIGSVNISIPVTLVVDPQAQ